MKSMWRGRNAAALIYLKNPCGFHYRGLLLALGETLGTVAVNIHTSESFAVVVKHGDLPVLMFPSSIAMHAIRFLCSLFFHGQFFPRASDYYKFIDTAQVSN
jgi:hypothetical protein